MSESCGWRNTCISHSFPLRFACVFNSPRDVPKQTIIMGDAIEWTLQPDGAAVRVCKRLAAMHSGSFGLSRGSRSECLPLSLATGAWLANGPRCVSERTPTYVLMSVATIPGTPHTLTVAVRSATRNPTPMVWPPWHPASPPAWQPCPVGRWVALPDSAADCAGVVAQCEALLRRSRQHVADGIRGRCETLVQQGEDENFTNSLEFCPGQSYF